MPFRSARVVTVRHPQLPKAVQVLARACAHDPLVRYIFADAGPRYRTRLREFFTAECLPVALDRISRELKDAG